MLGVYELFCFGRSWLRETTKTKWIQSLTISFSQAKPHGKICANLRNLRIKKSFQDRFMKWLKKPLRYLTKAPQKCRMVQAVNLNWFWLKSLHLNLPFKKGKTGVIFEFWTHPKRLMGLMCLLALAYVMVHQWGSRLNDKRAIKRKKHGGLAKSIFRYGLDHFRHAMRRLAQARGTITDILQLIFANTCFVR